MKIVLWLFFVLLAGVYICRPVVDPDLWWHITVGRWIISNHQVPATEHWNMFALGQPWVAYSWSNEVVLAAVDRWWPVHGLMFLQIVLACALSLSLAYCYSRLGKDWAFGALLGMYCTGACFSHFTLRPQSFVWILFIWLIYLCQKISEEGLSLKKAALIFGLMAVWANSHLSAFLGLLLIALWLFELPSPATERRADQAAWIKTLAAGFLGTLFTPYFGAEWLTFLSKTSHPFSHSTIVEFGPAVITQYATVFLVLLVFMVAAFFFKSPGSSRPWRLVGFGVFLVAAFAIVKFLPFAVILGGALLACAWGAAQGKTETLGNLAEGLQRLKGLVNRVPREGLSFVCLCLIIVLVNKLWSNPLDLQRTPKAALDFILEKNLPHPLLNTFGEGGYVMYRFADARGNLAHPVAIDGRTNVTPPEVAKAHYQALSGARTWREFINMVKPKTILWQANSPLVSILEAEGRWCTVFRNGQVVMLPKDYFETRKGEFKSENCG